MVANCLYIYKKQCIFTIHTPLYNNSKLKEGQHSTQHWQWKQPNCQAEDTVRVFLKHNYQKLTNWEFVVGTQHEKRRMEENTNKMTAGWKVKGRQRVLFMSTSSNEGQANFRECKQQQWECLHPEMLHKDLAQSICFPLTFPKHVHGSSCKQMVCMLS